MKRILLTSFVAVAAALITAGCAASTGNLVRTSAHPQLAKRGAATIGSTVDTELLGSLLRDYINLFRSKHNLPLFKPDAAATHAADWMARYQAGIGAVTHETGLTGMRTVAERYASSGGPEYAFSGENAAWTVIFDNDTQRNLTYDEMARRILDNWINSPSHHTTLVLNSDQSVGGMGLGLAQGSHSGWEGVYSTMDVIFHWPETVVTGSRTVAKAKPLPQVPAQSQRRR